MTEQWERETRLVDNFSKVPHGLWTCSLSSGAKLLIGWLHSHSSSYLTGLTIGRIRREFGSGGSVNRWLVELEEAGFILHVVDGNRHRYRLLAAGWDRLACRKPEHETVRNGQVQNGPTTETVRNGPANGREWTDKRSEMDTIEEHREDQREDQKTHSLAQSSKPAARQVGAESETESFDEFWTRYPRKVGKGAAQSRWHRLSTADRSAVLAAVPEHVARWREMRTETQFIPHPATWLSQRRWEDQLATDARREATMPSAVRHAADLLARLEHTDAQRPSSISLRALEQADEEEGWL